MLYNLKRRLRRITSIYYRITDEYSFSEGQKYSGPCPCCGSTNIVQKDILWDNLIDVWGLSNKEIAYINRQQGFRCCSCGSRFRSMALAAWLLKYFNSNQTLEELVSTSVKAKNSHILEINEAGHLSQFLKRLPNHKLGKYPEVDIQSLPYPNEVFDIVLHSDTLEHVTNPIQALAECRRVLKLNGVCAFTIPIVVDRLSRSTSRGLSSWHGSSDTQDYDLLVHTEFGADAWKTVINAGFQECTIFALEYPSALVLACKK